MKHTIIPILENRFPAYAKDYKHFKEFMIAYFEFLEQSGSPIEYANSFLDNTDSTNETALYWDKILVDVGWKQPLPDTIQKRIFVLFVRDYYLSRGTKNSLKFLFRLLYSEDVDIYYPRDDMLVLSNAEYTHNTIMVTSDISDYNTFRKLSQSARDFGLLGEGVISNSKMIVDNIVRSRGYVVMTISTTDTFIPGESIKLYGTDVSVVVQNIPHYEIKPGKNTTPQSKPVFEYANIKERTSGEIDDIIVHDKTGYVDIVKTEPSNGFFATFDGNKVTIHSKGRQFKELPDVRCGNAIMTATSATIGLPKKIECEEPHIENLEHEFDVIKSATFTTPGKWSSDNHILGIDCVITDSHYYQQFSYRIDSTVSRPEYEHIIKDEIHPAGVVMFSRMKLTIKNTLKGIKDANISII